MHEGWLKGCVAGQDIQRMILLDLRFIQTELEKQDWMKAKTPKKIFVSSMGDLFDPNVKIGWMWKVFDVIEQYPQHTFQVLTKNPKRLVVLKDFLQLPKNLWIGVSITTSADKGRLTDLWKSQLDNPKFISFEPLLGDIGDIILYDVQWIIIGQQTGHNPVVPQLEWVFRLIDEAKNARIPVFLKDNLHWAKQIQEFPKEMNVNV